MSVFCANKNNPSYQELVAAVGSEQAEQLWDINNGYPLTHTNTGEPSEFYQFIKGLYPDKNRVELLRVIGPVIKKYGPVSNSKVNTSKYNFGFDNIETEMQEIRTKAIANGDIKLKEDGTFDYALAPNGKRSNLNERQWLQVRTKAFKEWFGDWEKIAPKNKISKEEVWNSAKDIYNKSNEPYKELADKIFSLCQKIGIGLYSSNDFIGYVTGDFHLEDKSVRINKNYKSILENQESDKTLAQILLHEAIHSLTTYAINNPEYLTSQEAKDAVTTINACYERLKNTDEFKDNKYGIYGLKNEKEMVAELANPNFRKVLKKYSLFDKLISAVKSILNDLFNTNFTTKNDSIETSLLKSLDTLIESFDKDVFDKSIKSTLALRNVFDNHPSTIRLSDFEKYIEPLLDKAQDGDVLRFEVPNYMSYGMQPSGTEKYEVKGVYVKDKNNTVGRFIWQLVSSKPSNKEGFRIYEFKVDNKHKLALEQYEKDSNVSENNNSVSKVVDENGEPLVVYHGSPSIGFTTFEIMNEAGIHFGTKEAASGRGFASVPESIRAFFLNIKNIDTHFQDNMWYERKFINDYIEDGTITQEEGDKWINEARDYVNEMTKDNYDYYGRESMLFNRYVNKKIQELKGSEYGVAYINETEDAGSTSYIVFNPNQIKSATDNIGAFSKENDDIRYNKEKQKDVFNFIKNKLFNLWHFDPTKITKERHKVVHKYLNDENEIWLTKFLNDENEKGDIQYNTNLSEKAIEDFLKEKGLSDLFYVKPVYRFGTTELVGKKLVFNPNPFEKEIQEHSDINDIVTETDGKYNLTLLGFLQKRLNVPFKSITQKEAKELLKDKYNSSVNAFNLNGTAYFIKGRKINVDIKSEEMLHPFIASMHKKNPEVFSDLLKDAKKLFPQLYIDILNTYPEEKVDEELVTQALARVFVEEKKANSIPRKMQNFIDRFKKWVTSIFTKNPELKLNKFTLQDIAELINSDIEISYKKEFGLNLNKSAENKQIQQSNFPGPETKINIYAGTGENADLSNFAYRPVMEKSPLTGDYVTYNTVEGAFQAAKLGYTELSAKEMADIETKLMTATGAQAKNIGRTIKGLNTKEWDLNSSKIMKEIVYDSFVQNPSEIQKLLATGNATLTHTQDKGKWGKEFPRIIMEVREELREEFRDQQIQAIQQEQQSQNSSLISDDKAKKIMELAANQTKNTIVEKNKFKSEQVINEMVNAYKNLPAEVKEVIAEVEKKNNGNPLYMALSYNGKDKDVVYSELFYDAYFRTRDINYAIKVKSLIFTEKYKAFLNNSRLVVHGTKDYSDEHNIVYRQKNNEPRLFYLVEDNVYSSFPTLNKETQTYIPVFISTKGGQLISNIQKKQEELYNEAKQAVATSSEYAIVWIDSIKKSLDPISGNEISERRYFVNKDNIDSHVMNVDYVVNNYEHNEYIPVDKNNPTQQVQQQQTQPQVINNFNTYKDISANGEVVDVRYNLDYNPIATLESEKIDRPSVAELANITVEKVLGDKEAMKAKMTYDFANLVTSGQITENDRNELANTLLDKISETIDDIIAGNISNLSEFVDKDALRKAEASVREHWLDNEESLRKQIIKALGINTLIKESFYRVIKNNYNVLDFNGNTVKDTSALTKEELKIVNDVAILLKNKYCFLEHIKNQLYQYEGIKLVIDKNKVLDISDEIDKASEEEQKTVTENSEIDNSEIEPSAISIDAKSGEIDNSSDDDLDGFSFLENQLTKDFYASLSSTIKRKIHRISIREISKSGRSKIKRNKYGGRKYYNENVIYETLKKEFKDCLCGAKDKSNKGNPRDYLAGRSIEEKFEELNDFTIPWVRDVKRIFMNEAGYNQLFSAIGNMSENKYLNGDIKSVRVANMSLNKNTMRERIMQQASLNSKGKIIQFHDDITAKDSGRYYIAPNNYNATSQKRQNIYNVTRAFSEKSTPTIQDVINKYTKEYGSDIYTDLYKILDSIFISTISREGLKELMNSFKDGQALIDFLENITYNINAILQSFYDKSIYRNKTTLKDIESDEYAKLSKDERNDYSKIDIYKDPFNGVEWVGKILSNMTNINVAIGLEYSSLDSMLASQNINGKQYYSISPSNAIQRTINDIRAKDKDQYKKQVINDKVRKDFFFGGTTPNANGKQLYDEDWFNHIYKDLAENKSYFMFNTFASFMNTEYSKLSPQGKKFYNLKMYFFHKEKNNFNDVTTQYASVVTADKATTGTFTMKVFESDKNKGAYSGKGYSEVAQRMYSTFVQEMMRMKAVYNLAVAKDVNGKPVLPEENFTASLIKDDETKAAKMVSKVIDSETPNEKTIEHYIVDNHMKTGFRFAFMPYFNEAIEDKKTYSNENLEYINYLIYKYIYDNDSEAIFGNQEIMDKVCNIIEAELEKKAQNYMDEIRATVDLSQLLQVLNINFNDYEITATREVGSGNNKKIVPRFVDITELNWRSLFNANLIDGASEGIRLIVNGKEKTVSTFKAVSKLREDILSKIHDYTYNATYANSQILMLMTGDIARYKDYTDMQKRAAEFVSPGLTYNLTAKYNGALVSQDGLKNIMVFEDNEGTFTDMNQVSAILEYRKQAKLNRAKHAWDNGIISEREYKVLAKQIEDEYNSSIGSDGYTGTNATDGQSWISVDWLRKHLVMLDRFTPAARTALFQIDKMIDAVEFDKDGELTKESINNLKEKWKDYMTDKNCARFHIESIKPFAYTQMPIQNQTIDGIKTSTPVQFKNAEQAILDIEYAIKTLDVTALRIAKFLRDTGLDAIATKSNIKVGKRGIIKLDSSNIKTLLGDENVEGSLMNQKIISRRLATENPGNIDWSEGKINKDFIYSIPLQNAVLQQETPEDYFGETTILGSQAQVLITDACYDDTTWEIKHYNEDGKKGNTESVKGSDVRDRIDKLLAKKCEIGVEKLFDNIVDKNGNKCGRAILNKLKQGEMLTTNEQVMMNKMLANLLREHFEMDGKSTYDTLMQTTIMPDGYPYVPFNDPINWNKLQSVLVSIIKKHTVKSKVNGGHLVQVTDAFRFDKGIKESVKDGDVALDSKLKIIYNQGIINGKTVRDARFGIEYMEAAIPVYNPIIWKELVNADMTENGEVKKKYIDENGFIKMQDVPEAFKRIIAYRIPTEGYNSMFAVQCKFTTSRVNGGQIRLPWEITTIAGTDYDIDKLFFLSPAIRKFDNGSAKYITTNKPINEMSEAEVNNALFETMWSILTSPNVIEKQLNPGGFLRLKNERNMFSAFEQLIKNEIDKNGLISAEKKIELFNDVYTEKEQTYIKSIVSGRYENTDLCDPSVQDYIHMRNYVGAQMIGIFANQTQTHSRLKFKDVKIHGKELIRKILSQKKGFSIEFNFLNKSLSDTLVDFDPIYSRDMTTETIENLVQFLTAAVDAIKDPLLSSLNINLNTINIGIVMLRLGYTINDVILFLNQPVIKLLSSKGDMSDNIKKYIKNINKSLISNLNITQNDLISNIVDSSYSKKDQLIYDKKIARIAQYFLSISGELRDVINCCKISGVTTHTYKDYFELTDFMDKIDTYLEKNKEGETIFDESISNLFDKDSNMKSDTLITFRDDLKLLKKSLIEDINPYLGYHFKSILKHLKSINKRISAREVYDAYMKYMWWKHLGDSIWNTPANMDSRMGNDADENMFYAFDRLINESLRPMLKGIYDYITDNPGAYEDNEIIRKLILDHTIDNIDIVKLNVFDMALEKHQKMSSDLSELLNDKTMINVGDHMYPMSVIIEEILLNNIAQNGFDFSSKSVLRFLSATAKASNCRYINFLEKENNEHVNEEAFIELFLRNNPQYIPDLSEQFSDKRLWIRDSETDRIVQLMLTEDMVKLRMPPVISVASNIYRYSGDPTTGYYIVPKLGGDNSFDEYFDCLITKQTSSILKNNLDYLSIFNSDINTSYLESRDSENGYEKFRDNFENVLNLFDEEMFKDPSSMNEQGEYVPVIDDLLKEHIKFDKKMFDIISKRIKEKSYC